MASTPDGSIVVVGVPNATFTDANNNSYTGSGTVYVLTEPSGGWGSGTPAVDVLTVPTPLAGAHLGASVAISADGSTIVAGAPGDTYDCGTDSTGKAITCGATYVFNEPSASSGWDKSSSPANNELKETAPASGDLFGTSVAIYGSGASSSKTGANILVGAPGANSNAGAVYVFSYSVNNAASPLSATSTLPTSSLSLSAGDSFGTSVGIDSDGGAIIVGAPGYSSSQGEAFTFTFTPPSTAGGTGTSTYQKQLTASDGTAGDLFGASVAFTGSTVTNALVPATAVVGAPGLANTGVGAAYVFTAPGGTWTATQEAELTASAPTAGSQLGISVAISSDGSRILAGSLPVQLSAGSSPSYSPGTLYQFDEPSHGPTLLGWANENESADFQDSKSSQTTNDGFASSVAIGIPTSGRNIWLFGDAPNAGAAYVFQSK